MAQNNAPLLQHKCLLYCLHECQMLRVGQNRIYTPYTTVYLVISLPKLPYIHRTYMVLANPTNAVFKEQCCCIPTHPRTYPRTYLSWHKPKGTCLSSQMPMFVHSNAHVVDWTARVSHSDAHVCPLSRSCVSAQMHTSSTQIPMLVHSDHGGQKLHAYHPRAKDTRPHTGDLGNLQVSWLWYLGLAKAIHIHTYVYTVFSTGNLPYLRSYVHIRFWPTLMIMDERMCAWCRSALQAISLFNLHGYWIWVATQLKGTKGTSHSYTQLQNERK